MWSRRLKGSSAPTLVVMGRLQRALVLFLPDSYAMLMRPNKAETAVHGGRVIWLCACVRYWPDLGLVFECATCFYCGLSSLPPSNDQGRQRRETLVTRLNTCLAFALTRYRAAQISIMLRHSDLLHLTFDCAVCCPISDHVMIL